MGYFHSASSRKCSALAWPRGRQRAGVGRQSSSQRMQGPSLSLDKSLSIRESTVGGLGDAACLWQVPSWSGASWAAPTARARLGDALAPQGTATQPPGRPRGVPLQSCRAARAVLEGDPGQTRCPPRCSRSEKPSSHTRIYRKSLHQSINSSPTDAAGNTSPVWGELWEMELTPTAALSPLSPSSEAVEHPAALQDPGGAIAMATGFPCPPLPACQDREQNPQGPLIRTGSQSFAAEILGLEDKMGRVRGYGSGLGDRCKEGKNTPKKLNI